MCISSLSSCMRSVCAAVRNPPSCFSSVRVTTTNESLETNGSCNTHLLDRNKKLTALGAQYCRNHAIDIHHIGSVSAVIYALFPSSKYEALDEQDVASIMAISPEYIYLHRAFLNADNEDDLFHNTRNPAEWIFDWNFNDAETKDFLHNRGGGLCFIASTEEKIDNPYVISIQSGASRFGLADDSVTEGRVTLAELLKAESQIYVDVTALSTSSAVVVSFLCDQSMAFITTKTHS